jgi:hypothetical protein
MAAFVLVPPSPVNGHAWPGQRLNLFPGSATPAVFAASQPFWIGYGFIAEPGTAASTEVQAFDERTRFELEVDGEAVSMLTDVHEEDGVAIRRVDVAEFPAGLPAGWHDFSGRWYEQDRLIVSSRTSIQFVER